MTDWFWPTTKKAQLEYVFGLRLSPSQRKECLRNLGKVSHVVHTYAKRHVPTIDRVMTGGSVGKGTASSKSSDLDLVVFVKELQPKDMKKVVPKILGEIRAAMDEQYPGTRDPAWPEKFGLRYIIDSMEIDIVIASTMIQPKDFLNVKDSEQRQYMSSSVSHLQKRFMKKQGFVFKDMVRVLKDWRDSYDNWPNQSKPKSYLLELLLLHSYRQCFPQFFRNPKDPNQLAYYPNLTLYKREWTTLLMTFFELVGNVEPYQKGKMYNKDTISLLVHFATY